jgi:hypothetical protein
MTGRRRAGQRAAASAAVALPVLAAGPAARPPLAFFELLLRPADPAFPRHLLLGVLDPADELVASERRDVPPRVQRNPVRTQRQAEILGQRVDHPTRHVCVAHPPDGTAVLRPRSPNADGCVRQTDTCEGLSPVKGDRSQSAHRSASSRPANLAMRSSSSDLRVVRHDASVPPKFGKIGSKQRGGRASRHAFIGPSDEAVTRAGDALPR